MENSNWHGQWSTIVFQFPIHQQMPHALLDTDDYPTNTGGCKFQPFRYCLVPSSAFRHWVFYTRFLYHWGPCLRIPIGNPPAFLPALLELHFLSLHTRCPPRISSLLHLIHVAVRR